MSRHPPHQADDPPGPPDDELEIELRPPTEAADRCIVLAAVCRRAYLETQPAEDNANLDDERYDLVAWLQDEALDPAVSSAERRFLQTEIGRLDPGDAVAASWQSEALVAIGWALGLIDAPPSYDGPVDLGPLLSLLPSPWDRTAPFRQRAALRELETVAHERERAELWSWRADVAATSATARGAARTEIDDAIAEVAHQARSAGFIAPLVDGDFSIGGQPVRALDTDATAEISLLAEQRLRALNWLCGFGSDWDDVPLDV